MAKKFQRRMENFSCQHCGAFVIGNGYTNHCPHCLWSRHLDTYPGDRLESCGGLMEPVLLEGSSPQYRILHKCVDCGAERVNTVTPDDSTEAIINLAKNPHPPIGVGINVQTGEKTDPLAKEESYPEADKGEMEPHRKHKK